jgi:hypothetical protein
VSPFTVNSTAKVKNLNADQLDGLDSAALQKRVKRDLCRRDGGAGRQQQRQRLLPDGGDRRRWLELDRERRYLAEGETSSPPPTPTIWSYLVHAAVESDQAARAAAAAGRPGGLPAAPTPTKQHPVEQHEPTR